MNYNKLGLYFLFVSLLFYAAGVMWPLPDITEFEACLERMRVAHECLMNRHLYDECIANPKEKDCSKLKAPIVNCASFEVEPERCSQSNYAVILIMIAGLFMFLSLLTFFDVLLQWRKQITGKAGVSTAK